MEALAIGLTAQRALSRSVESIAYNVANSSTAGFRGIQIKFDRLEGRKHGESVDFVESNSGFLTSSPGPLIKTGNPLDFAVSSDRWIGVQTQSGAGYTKDGRLNMAPSGLLQTIEGLPVLDSNGAAVVLNPSGGAAEVRADGSIFQDGAALGRLGLFSLAKSANLERLSPLVFRADVVGDMALGEGDVASVQQGYLESSNVNPLTEMTKLVSAQRLFDNATALVDSCEATFNEAIKTLAVRG